jgi:hypothetical protein
MRPELIAGSGTSVLVYDSGDNVLLAFGVAGEPLWRFGRKGGGPEEFGAVADLKGDGTGGALLLDSGNSRLAAVTSRGSLMAVTATTQVLHRIAVGTDGSIIAAPLNDVFLVRVLGNVIASSMPVPPELRALGPLQRENYLGSTSSGSTVVVHRWSTTVIVATSDFRSYRSFQLIDAQPFPAIKSFKAGPAGQYAVSRIDPTARPVRRASYVFADTLLVVDARTESAAQHMLDVYDVSAGKYLYSQRIPAYPLALARVGDRLFALVNEPAPALVIWELSSAQIR